MKLVKMNDGNVLNADAITHIIQEDKYSIVYFAGGTKLSYLGSPAEVADYINHALSSDEKVS